MSGRDHGYSDPRWAHSGRDPRSEGQTSQPRPSRDDDRRPIGYNPSGSAPYQVAPAQPPYHQVPIQYPTSHPPPHGLVPVQAFPPQRAPTHPYHAQGPYGPPFQPQPPPGGAPTLWHPPPASIANTESGNTENSNIGGSYNNNSTRTDQRVNAQVAAHMSNTQTVFIQNLHVSPTGHAPAAIPSGGFPSAISYGQFAPPIDNLTTQIRETTITSSEGRYESYAHVPPGYADFDNRYLDPSRSSKTRSSTVPIPAVKEEYDYTHGQRGYPGEGSSRPPDPRVPHSSRRLSHSVLQSTVQDRLDYSFRGPQDESRVESSKGDKSFRKASKDMFNPYSSGNTERVEPRSSSYTSSQRHRRRDEDNSKDSSSGDETASSRSHSRKGRRRGDIRSKMSFIAPRLSLDTYHGSSEPSGLSTASTAAHSSRSPPNTSTSIPQRNEEENPPYGTRASGWGSSRPSEPSHSKSYEPSHRKPYNPYFSPDTTQPPHYGPSPGWPAQPPHPGAMRGNLSYSSGDKDPRTLNVAGYPTMQRRLTDIVESQLYNPSQQTLAYKIQPLGNPSLVPFIKGKGNENVGVKRSDDSHIPLYMCSNIIDPDSVALWFPAPTLFPPGGGRRGVQLGDLGYFDDAGELRPIFNIFHSYEQNLAEGARPPDPPYQPLRIDFRSVVRHIDIQRQQTYTSSNIERPQEAGSHPPTRYQFRTYKQSGRSGAIIVLPHGGSSVCIRNSYFQLPEVKQHFRDHAPSWYQHALRLIGRKPNGSLVLVRATHCAKSWGIAAFASKRDIREPLYATFLSNPANEYQHMWQTNDNRWKTSTGPSLVELGELGGREPPLNQCVGVVISSLRLDDATWQTNFGSTSGPPSGSDRSSGGSLRRVLLGDSWSTIHVTENSERTTSRLLDFIRGRTVDMRHMGVGDADYTLLLQEEEGDSAQSSWPQRSSGRQAPKTTRPSVDTSTSYHGSEPSDLSKTMPQQHLVGAQAPQSNSRLFPSHPDILGTCWIAAERALRHIHSSRPQIDMTFRRYDIGRLQYAVCAGFDETCIRRDSGYLEQIHIFTLSIILETSPLLTELGKVLSPFSSILFTKSSSFRLPVYKDDGTIWEFEELVFETASDHLDRGTTTSINQTLNTQAGEPPRDSGSGDKENTGKKDSKRSEDKGKGRAKDNADGGENPDDAPRDDDFGSDNPDDPKDEVTEEKPKEMTSPPYVAFEIASTIRSTTSGNLTKVFQEINTAGVLTFQMDANPTSPTCRVQFTKLEFGNSTRTPDVAYRQFHCRVIVDSRRFSRITNENPQRTLASTKETTVTVSSKTTKTRAGGITFEAATSRILPLPNFIINATGNFGRADEEDTSLGTTQLNYRITQQAARGVAWWGFNVDDPNRREDGTVLEGPELPTATFHFRTGANMHTHVPIPERIDVEVASYWSIIPSPTVTANSGWLSKILPLTPNSPVPQYSHLCQMTALNIPSDLKENCDYFARLNVESTGQRLHFDTDVVYPSPHPLKIETQIIRRADNTLFDYGDVRNSSLDLPSVRPNFASGPSSAFPSISSGQPARSMGNLRTQMRETVIASPERRYESHSRDPPDDEDFGNRYLNRSRNKSKMRSPTVSGLLVDDKYDYMHGQRRAGEGTS